jgi:hypothetical protein
MVDITVKAVNDAPTVSSIADKTIEKDTNTGFMAFAVGDVETSAGDLTVTGSSSNTTLVPNSNIIFGGSGADRTVKVTPAAGRTGTAQITVRVNDGSGAQATATFVLTVQDTKAPRVIGVTPAHLATGVAPTANVLATFSEAMNANTLRNPDTLRSNTFTLVRRNADGSTTRVAATVSYNASTKKATLNPSKSLVRGATYVARVTTGAKDVAGNALDQNPSVSGNQSKVWTFRVRN